LIKSLQKRATHMKKLSLTVKSIYGFGLIAVLSLPLMAAAPALINYQGKLTDASGTAISGDKSVTFRFYSAASGGSQIGTDQVVTISAIKGVFSTTISVPAGLFLNNPTVFLGIQVDGSSEFTDRQQLVSAPYALAIQDGSVSGGEGGTITDGTITDSDISSISSGKVSGLGALATAGTVSGGLGGTITDGSITDDDISSISSGKVSGLGALATAGTVSGGLGGTITDGSITDDDISSISSGKVSGLGALATAGTVSGGLGGTITDGTIDGNDLNSSALSLSVYKTSDNRLVLDKNYKTIACSYDEGTLKFFGCDGSCDQTQPASCTAGEESFVGRLVK
jgi:hypothetical protein